MKKTIAILLTAYILLTTPLFWFAHHTTTRELYALAGVIVEIDEAADLVVFKDANGNLWEFEGIEDYSVGDFVACVVNDMGTSSIYDDVIISVRYTGYVA